MLDPLVTSILQECANLSHLIMSVFLAPLSPGERVILVKNVKTIGKPRKFPILMYPFKEKGRCTYVPLEQYAISKYVVRINNEFRGSGECK